MTSREEVWRKIKEKQESAGGFLTDETAARLVASELGVEVEQALVDSGEFPIAELVLGLNNVSVVGRVVFVYPLQSYLRKNGAENHLAHLIIADKTGTLRVLLWDNRASLVRDGKISRGQVVRILHGYVREARDGQLELHLGDRGQIQVDPQDANKRDYPTNESFLENISSLTTKKKKASIAGTVENVSPIRVFQRKDKTEGKVLQITLKDASGRIRAVFWNNKADDLKDMQVGERLQIIDAKIRQRVDGPLELHVEDKTYVEKLPPLKEEFSKISKLISEGGPIQVEGLVKTKPLKREVLTARGEKVSVTTFELEDDSGRIWISAWREHADIASQVSVGVKVRLKNVYARKGFGESLELTTRASSHVEIVKD